MLLRRTVVRAKSPEGWAAHLPEEVLALLDPHLLGLGGSYGDPNVGDPMQYDYLRIEHERGAVEITVYQPGDLLFTTDSEAVSRITRCAAGSKTWRLVSDSPRRRRCSGATRFARRSGVDSPQAVALTG